MEKTKSDLLKRFRSAWPWALNLLFYGSICWIILISELPPVTGAVFLMRKQFLAGNETLFRAQNPGLRFTIFAPYFSGEKTISFLTDTPYEPEHAGTEALQAAQGQWAPLLLNPEPVEKTALVFCSQNAIAAARMQATGYQSTKVLGNGKMIAEKRS
jgi:hypothetical protein